MSRCKQCGNESDNRYLCHSCRKKWLAKREVAFDQAVSEIGPLNAENLKAIQKRVKQLEKDK